MACALWALPQPLLAQLYTLNAGEFHAGGALVFDSTEQRLYATFAYPEWNGYQVNSVAVWDGTEWTSVGGGFLDGGGYYAALHDGQYFLSGAMENWVNGYDIYHLGRWDGTEWHSCGEPDGYTSFLKIGEELWIGSAFDSIGDVAISEIARWNGTQWEAFGDPIPPNEGITHCGDIYQGHYYFGGTHAGSGIFGGADIIMWSGEEWIVPGGGTPDPAMTILQAMKSYHGKLYIGGGIQSGPSHNIIVWNGSSYEGFFPDLVYNVAGVYQMEVIGDKLYIAGSWLFAGDTRTYGLLIYDGTTLCGVGYSGLGPELEEIRQFAGDSHRIYFNTTNYVLSGDSVNFFGYWNQSDGPDTCITIPVGMRESEVDRVLPVFPNPADEVLHVELGMQMGKGSAVIVVHDGSGRMALQQEARIDERGTATLAVGALSPGFYHGAVSGDKRRIFRFIKH